MIEIAFLIVLVFLILVFFYKQTATEFHILQIEQDKLETLPELLTEKNPLVIRGLGEPKLLTPEILRTNARLGGAVEKFMVPSGPSSPRDTPADLRKFLATESGLQVWAEHMWYPKLTEDLWYAFCLSMDSDVYVSSFGLQKTCADFTIFYPTSGEFVCSLMMNHAQKFLPVTWEGRFMSDLTPADCPLLHEIQYIDVILRPGHMLILPPHWLVTLKAKDGTVPICGMIEIHTPLTKLAKVLQ
jgi:hypothetical protein